MRIRLVFHDNGGGLTRDADILASALAATGARVTTYRLDDRNTGQRILNRIGRLARTAAVDANIFLENGLSLGLLESARKNVLIPNPEWMDDTTSALMGEVDLVACKSADAMERLARFSRPMRLLGFTTGDRHQLVGREGYPAALHVAGGSPNKGTRAVCAAWERHPEWPALTVVAHEELVERLGVRPAPNLRVLSRIADEDLRQLQNRAWLHLCPSESEGYGHTIAEAMSCGALVLTSDAPPMNELVQPDRGILVRTAGAEPMRHGARHEVTAEAVEEGVLRSLAMPAGEESAMRQAARAWFLSADARFRGAVGDLVEELARAPG